jgi:hypothetical protein
MDDRQFTLQQRKRLALIAALLLVLLSGAIMVSGVFASAKLEEGTGYQTQCVITDPGQDWMADGIWHVRNMKKVYRKTGDFDFSDGLNYSTVNWSLNLATGSGTAWGTFILEPDDYEGTIEGSFSGQITNYLYSGKGVGLGKGDLKGVQVKVESRQLAPDDPEMPPDLCDGDGAPPIQAEVFDSIRVLWPHGE